VTTQVVDALEPFPPAATSRYRLVFSSDIAHPRVGLPRLIESIAPIVTRHYRSTQRILPEFGCTSLVGLRRALV
jgi:hypothetical protein